MNKPGVVLTSHTPQKTFSFFILAGESDIGYDNITFNECKSNFIINNGYIFAGRSYVMAFQMPEIERTASATTTPTTTTAVVNTVTAVTGAITSTTTRKYCSQWRLMVLCYGWTIDGNYIFLCRSTLM